MDYFINSLTQYYLTDWVAMICQFIGMFLIARRNRHGFAVFALGNLSWIIYASFTGSIAQISANIVVGFFNVYGYWHWKEETKKLNYIHLIEKKLKNIILKKI